MLPDTIRVKLSSEEAGAVSITPVVVREMPLRELVETMLGVAGKDAARIRELLLRGTFVSGASRFRWAGFEAELAGLEEMLVTFPGRDAARPFDAGRCLRAVFRGPGGRGEFTREAAARRRFLRRRSFWDVLMEVAMAASPDYLDYSYKEKADCYRLPLTPEIVACLRQHAGLLRYSSMQQQIRRAAFDSVDLYVSR